MNITMNNKISKKDKVYNNVLLILSNVIVNTIIISMSLFIKEMQFEVWLLPFAILSLIQLFMNVMTIVNLEKKFFSLTTLFLIFSFVTHLGILIIFGFKIDIALPWDPLISITPNVFKEACYFTVICHAFLTFGMCLVLSKRKKCINSEQQKDKIEHEKRELYLAKKVGITLFILGICPMLYIDINRIMLYMNGNYVSTYEVGVNGFVIIIARMAEIGAMLLLIGNHKNKKKSQFIIFLILVYQSLILYTGNRGRPVMYILVIFFIYYNFIKGIKFKEFINIAIVLYFVGFLLTFIGQVRMLSIDNVNALLDVFGKSFLEFSIFKILAEFGVTIITLGYSLVFFPSLIPFQIGTNYLASFLTIFPNINGILFPIVNKTIYIYNWPSNVRVNLGGSYLGELYYSFGSFSFIFAIFIGMMVAFVSNQINKYIAEKKYVKLSIYLILFINLLWWIRNYFGDMVRECVWISLIIIILYKIFNNKIPRIVENEV